MIDIIRPWPAPWILWAVYEPYDGVVVHRYWHPDLGAPGDVHADHDRLRVLIRRQVAGQTEWWDHQVADDAMDDWILMTGYVDVGDELGPIARIVADVRSIVDGVNVDLPDPPAPGVRSQWEVWGIRYLADRLYKQHIALGLPMPWDKPLRGQYSPYSLSRRLDQQSYGIARRLLVYNALQAIGGYVHQDLLGVEVSGSNLAPIPGDLQSLLDFPAGGVADPWPAPTDALYASLKDVTSTLAVTGQPASPTIVVGASADLTVDVSGGWPPYTFEWWDGASPGTGSIVQAASSSPGYHLASPAVGTYTRWCKIVDYLGTVLNSNVGTVTVQSAPPPALSVSTQPAGWSGPCPYGWYVQCGVSGGYPPYTFQCYKNGAAVYTDQATGWNPAVQTTGVGGSATPRSDTFYFVVTDSHGYSVTSSSATITNT